MIIEAVLFRSSGVKFSGTYWVAQMEPSEGGLFRIIRAVLGGPGSPRPRGTRHRGQVAKPAQVIPSHGRC